MSKILIIDDDLYILELLKGFLEKKGYKTEGYTSGRNALKSLTPESFSLVLCDYRLPDTDGEKMLRSIRKIDERVPVIIMTAYSEIKTAVKLIKEGAMDYITKPVQPEEILRLVKRAEQHSSGNSNQESDKYFIRGESAAMKEVLKHTDIVAPTELTVLIQGETGTGKEFIAREIHKKSQRSDQPFMAVDCGALPKELANSELFGHVKGSFTGAVRDKMGYFEKANGGTLFLDEVGNLPYENQVKLLRAIQQRLINRVGDTRSIEIDVRIISASNEDLAASIHGNTFREDLYHRLNGFKIDLPPLRERDQDIFIFAYHFIDLANEEFGKKVVKLNNEVEELLLKYPWHGNIRELQNVITRCVLLCEGQEITVDLLPDEIKHHKMGINSSVGQPNSRLELSELKEVTSHAEREMIISALKKTKYNKSKAARFLNIDRKTLYNKIKEYKIDLLET